MANDGANGGAMWLDGPASPLVVGCEIHLHSVGGIGGGIGIGADATPTIRDCDIHDNSASSGGGICSASVGALVEGCTISGNDATYGGGIALMGAGGFVINDTRLAWNEAVHSGGGLHGFDSSVEMHDCIVEDNSTQGAGGAVWLLNTDATFTASAFFRNSAIESTGGILIDTSMLTVSESEVAGNGVGLAVAGTEPSSAVARHNWWGHSSGPFHLTLNPGGLGDAVGDGVEFTPWNVATGIAEHGVLEPVSWGAIKAGYR